MSVMQKRPSRPSSASLARKVRAEKRERDYQRAYREEARRLLGDGQRKPTFDDRLVEWRDKARRFARKPIVQSIAAPAAVGARYALQGLRTIVSGPSTVYHGGRPYSPIQPSELINVVKLNAAYPDIPIPDADERENLRFGQNVKLLVDRNGKRERIWVTIIKVGPRALGVKRRYVGRLKRPYQQVRLVSGQQVSFGPEHVYDIV